MVLKARVDHRMNISRVHITGGPGSGKTTLSWQIAASLNAPRYELDRIVYPTQATAPTQATEQTIAEWAAEAQRISMSDRWVSDGSYSAWAEPLFQSADLLVWLDIPWRTASYRIVSRHIKATIARNNRFPGLRRLYRFWSWSRGYYHDRTDPGLNDYGVPNTRKTVELLLDPYKEKLTVCRTGGDINDLLAQTLVASGT